MTLTDSARNDIFSVLALSAPLAARLHADDAEVAMDRLALLALALGVTYAWAIVFARATSRPLGGGLPAIAFTFVLMLPGPAAWGTVMLSLSFGVVFGREIFGGRFVLPPALIGLAFAIFSFPNGGFEVPGVLSLAPDPVFSLSCLAAAMVLLFRGLLAWQVAAGAVLGAAAAALLMDNSPWWQHLQIGAFAAGVLFLAAAPQSAGSGAGARWLHGILVGALVVLIRVANPEQPDGVVFAALVGGLFAPLIDRALGLRLRHE